MPKEKKWWALKEAWNRLKKGVFCGVTRTIICFFLDKSKNEVTKRKKEEYKRDRDKASNKYEKIN